MEIDYSMPLVVQCIMPDSIPNMNGGIDTKWVHYRLAIQWRDILAIEEFVTGYKFPPHSYGQLANVKIIGVGTHLVCASFDSVFAQWQEYKEWSKSRPDYLFSRN